MLVSGIRFLRRWRFPLLPRGRIPVMWDSPVTRRRDHRNESIPLTPAALTLTPVTSPAWPYDGLRPEPSRSERVTVTSLTRIKLRKCRGSTQPAPRGGLIGCDIALHPDAGDHLHRRRMPRRYAFIVKWLCLSRPALDVRPDHRATALPPG